MKILCTIKRKLGTHPQMPDDGTVYAFLPNAQGDHVAEVSNPAHVARLLAIPSFEVYGAEAAPPAADTGEAEGEAALTDEELAKFSAELDTLTLEDMQAEYHYRFGRAAPKQIKFDTLLKKLAEARAAKE
jgi:hypothetical protein